MSLMILKLRKPKEWSLRVSGWSLLLPLCLLGLWQLTAIRHWMPDQIVPAPATVLATGWSLLQDDLLAQWWSSLHQLIIGVVLGIIAGSLLGLLFGLSRRASAWLEPLFWLLVQIPTLGWIPLFMVMFGIGDGLKLAVLIKSVLVPVTLNTQQAVENLPAQLREVAQALRLSPRQQLLRLVIPASLPGWFTGCQLALAEAWISLIVVELLASSSGIGYLMVWGRQLFQLDIVFVTIVVIGLSGVLLSWLAARLQQRVIFWPQTALSVQPPGAKISLQGIGLPLLLLVLWQVASHEQWIDVRLFASPAAVIARLYAGVMSGELSSALAQSLLRMAAGALLGIGAGLLAGIALAQSPFARRLILPSLNALRQVALFAWLPLLSAWVGNDNPGKITFIALAAFFPMTISTLNAALRTSPQLMEVAQVLRFNRLQRLRWLVLPGAAPGIFAGIRLALIYAWLGSIGAEYFMSSGTGIGSLMINAQQLLDMPTIMSGMLLIGLTGALLNKGGRLLEQRATRWRQQEEL